MNAVDEAEAEAEAEIEVEDGDGVAGCEVVTGVGDEPNSLLFILWNASVLHSRNADHPASAAPR